MSRARPIGGMWFDQRRNHEKATGDQLQLLAAAENLSIDDLLDESLSQGQVIYRLRLALHGEVIPVEVIERRRRAREEAQKQPECRICGKTGQSTKHHFVNRWLMRELENYQAYAARTRCTIPVCIECHRDLHSRDGGDKSIWQYLTEHERKFAEKMLEELKEQHPKIYELLAGGNSDVYEAQLVKDHIRGEFRKQASREVEEMQTQAGG